MAPLKTFTIEPEQKHTATVIFLHGFGDTGMGWQILSDELGARFPYVKWIFPHAPVIPITFQEGMRSHAWYDILSFSSSTPEQATKQEQSIHGAVEMVLPLIKIETNQHNIPPSRIVLGGFSQGCALSLYVALTSREFPDGGCGKLGGVIAFAGALPISAARAREIVTPTNRTTPFFLLQGDADNRVTVERGIRNTEKVLREIGFSNLQSQVYRGLGHEVRGDVISGMKEFLEFVFEGPRSSI
ncbi:Phospholipase/carboxylesterase [Gonapodya prolifera JEL478]|uniref:Acyl-protein thioesterase 1 n=1 Tax=Gonapodya prolifera (strain JEL478) TaxID=1344416 RepID=A0A139AZP0_GONPJ|nr:Phospholipase/carboxylesterase [Gonapodya prolifera JEL478]|eukprot:KXS22206.1 Phospholipase/carboxylesterase [Gonapodya prolifera JEL478]